MNEINKTLFIPLYGKARVSRQHIILNDPTAEKIWEAEGFPLRRKAKSKWLAYNMAMRARVFDDWTEAMLERDEGTLVLHVGCGLDSRCRRVKRCCTDWIDCDLPEVMEVRKKYYTESVCYHMIALDASEPEQVKMLPDSGSAIVILEGLSMYLTKEQLHGFLSALRDKYPDIRLMMDVYTEFGARTSRVGNPVSELGVSALYGIDDLPSLLKDLRLRVRAEHSFTPERLIDELRPAERALFKLLFTGKLYGRLYRLFALEST